MMRGKAGQEFPEQQRVAVDRLRQDARHGAAVVFAVDGVEAEPDRHDRHQDAAAPARTTAASGPAARTAAGTGTGPPPWCCGSARRRNRPPPPPNSTTRNSSTSMRALVRWSNSSRKNTTLKPRQGEPSRCGMSAACPGSGNSGCRWRRATAPRPTAAAASRRR